MNRPTILLVALLGIATAGCDSSSEDADAAPADAAGGDAQSPDATVLPPDAGAPDATVLPPDAGVPDAGALDGGGNPGHTEDNAGILHMPGKEDPLGTCTTCHGEDLRGDTAPSCYTCHNNDDHTIDRSGHMHRSGSWSSCQTCHGHGQSWDGYDWGPGTDESTNCASIPVASSSSFGASSVHGENSGQNCAECHEPHAQ